MTFQKSIHMFCLAILLSCLMGCAATSTQESTGQYLDDSAITTKVKTALLQEPGLKSMQVTVETYKGVVQLSGFVSSSAMAAKATEVARKVTGVREVHNDMRVRAAE
jgi:Predicted periplasmic or secreted lipoprotein